MPKQTLPGTFDEQVAAVYAMVEERMASGRYSGAVHYAKEIIKVEPNYRDIQGLLRRAKAAQREQNLTLVISLLGAILLVALTRGLGLTADWQSLLVSVVGLFLGFLFATWLFHRRSPGSSSG